jgi:putative tryptophan/tyrosine transport system substrate-binding protein
VTRVAVLREASVAAGIGQFAAIQAAGSIGMELSAIDLREVSEIERDVAAFALGSNGGVVVTGSKFLANHSDLIPPLAIRYKLPTIYPLHHYVSEGGLICYGPTDNQFGPAADYVDRILKGEKPGDLPVQASTRFKLAINLKAAKAIGLEVPPSLLARADEVIE